MKGLLQDKYGDLLVQNGDFVRGDITSDIVVNIVDFMPADNKAAPIFGAGLRLSLGGTIDVFAVSKIKKQLDLAKIDFEKIAIRNGELNIKLK